MHHHDVVAVGHAHDLRAFKHDLVAAGAEHLETHDTVHLEWQSDEPAAVETLASAHPEVEVSIRRTSTSDEDVREITVAGGRKAMDRVRRIFHDTDGEVSCEWGLCMDEDGARLDPALLRRAADSVLAADHPPRQGALSAGIRDALLLGEQAGELAAASRDPDDDTAPTPQALDALRRVASLGLTLSCSPPMASEDLHASRTWRMREVLVRAGAEELWSEPGAAAWPEWLQHVIGGLCQAIEACQDCSWHPVTVAAGDDRAWPYTPGRHREAATGSLVAICLQTLALFESAD